jgi:hypothetical protein
MSPRRFSGQGLIFLLVRNHLIRPHPNPPSRIQDRPARLCPPLRIRLRSWVIPFTEGLELLRTVWREP